MSRRAGLIYFIWLMVLIIASVSFYFFYLNGEMEQLQQRKTELSFTEQKVDALKARIQGEGEEKISMLELRSKIPETLDEAQVIQMLNRASSRSNTVINNYNYQEQGYVTLDEIFHEEEGSSNLEILRLRMQITGRSSSLQNFNRFIETIESDPRLVIFDNLSFQAAGEEEITFQLVFSVYAY